VAKGAGPDSSLARRGLGVGQEPSPPAPTAAVAGTSDFVEVVTEGCVAPAAGGAAAVVDEVAAGTTVEAAAVRCVAAGWAGAVEVIPAVDDTTVVEVVAADEGAADAATSSGRPVAPVVDPPAGAFRGEAWLDESADGSRVSLTGKGFGTSCVPDSSETNRIRLAWKPTRPSAQRITAAMSTPRRGTVAVLRSAVATGLTARAGRTGGTGTISVRAARCTGEPTDEAISPATVHQLTTVQP
jgi:hypothetical protein